MTFKIYLKNGFIAYAAMIRKENKWLYATDVIVQEGKREPKFNNYPYAVFPYENIIFYIPFNSSEFDKLKANITKESKKIPKDLL